MGSSSAQCRLAYASIPSSHKINFPTVRKESPLQRVITRQFGVARTASADRWSWARLMSGCSAA